MQAVSHLIGGFILISFADPHVDMVLVDGITLLCNDLQVAVPLLVNQHLH